MDGLLAIDANGLGMKRILFLFIFFSAYADPGRDGSVGCMDAIREKLARLRLERRQQAPGTSTTCCLFPARMLQAMCGSVYRAFND